MFTIAKLNKIQTTKDKYNPNMGRFVKLSHIFNKKNVLSNILLLNS